SNAVNIRSSPCRKAESLLKAGTYLSNVPYAISEEDVIAKGELVYRQRFELRTRYFMPSYPLLGRYRGR
ncbi:MAG: hypothetical protein V8T10_00005, partial [Merdibacter sp.]